MKCIYCNHKYRRSWSLTLPRYKCTKCPYEVESSVITDGKVWCFVFSFKTADHTYQVMSCLNTDEVIIYLMKNRKDYTGTTWRFKNAINKITPYNIENKIKTLLTFQ